MSTGPTWSVVPIVLVVELVVVGALLAGIVSLLANPRTRAATAKTLAILAAVIAVPVVLAFLGTSRSQFLLQHAMS
jgi:hypothetical protein